MNKTTTKTLCTLVLICLIQAVSYSQISVVSTTGYAVNIDVAPIAINPSTNSCAYGYLYTVKMRYNISITGKNAPSSLYTLQGSVGCGNTASFFDLPNSSGSGSVNSVPNWSSLHNCATVTVASMECTQVSIEISGPGISYRVVTFTPSPAALSVKLVNFTAQQEKSRVKLGWTTATETDNNNFTIERSTDGAEWKDVKTVKGAGNSTSTINYEAYDDEPVAGNMYYRLKQTDFDGQKSYSDVQLVKYISLTKGVSLYPVPNAGNTVNITGITDYRNHDIALLNAAGNIIYTTTLTKAAIDLPALQPGVYFIRLKDKVSGETQNLRYIKI